jgi:hypothetical protein
VPERKATQATKEKKALTQRFKQASRGLDAVH